MRVFPQSLCHHCQGVQYTQSKSGALFLMCTLTPRRYSTQPITICSAYTERKIVKAQIHRHNTLEVALELSIYLPPKLSTQLIVSGQKSVWHRHVSKDNEKVFFEKSHLNLELEECFEDYLRQEKPQLTPGGALVFHREGLLEWVENPKRLHVFGWVEFGHSPTEVLMIRRAFHQASQITFLL